MTDLGITDFDFHAELKSGVYVYTLHFVLLTTSGMYSTRGQAPTPLQAMEEAMSYIAFIIRDVKVAE
jgi:hypothetical protein